MATEDGSNEAEAVAIPQQSSSPNGEGTQVSNGGDSAAAEAESTTALTSSTLATAPKPATSTVNRQLFFSRLRTIVDRWKKAKQNATAGNW